MMARDRRGRFTAERTTETIERAGPGATPMELTLGRSI